MRVCSYLVDTREFGLGSFFSFLFLKNLDITNPKFALHLSIMDLYSKAVADAPETLGGIRGDVDPPHPNVLSHLCEWVLIHMYCTHSRFVLAKPFFHTHPRHLVHKTIPVTKLSPGQDLTRVTIPPWYLESRSLLERWADVLMHPELLHGVFALPTPQERILAITKWFLSGWHYKTVGAKKPFNPIVGETFACFWPHEDGSRTQFFSEQVLHRPPISCVYFENPQHHFRANSHIWTKGSFIFPQSSKSVLDGGCRECYSHRPPRFDARELKISI